MYFILCILKYIRRALKASPDCKGAHDTERVRNAYVRSFSYNCHYQLLLKLTVNILEEEHSGHKGLL